MILQIEINATFKSESVLFPVFPPCGDSPLYCKAFNSELACLSIRNFGFLVNTHIISHLQRVRQIPHYTSYSAEYLLTKPRPSCLHVTPSIVRKSGSWAVAFQIVTFTPSQNYFRTSWNRQTLLRI